jgi:hypothetical protein
LEELPLPRFGTPQAVDAPARVDERPLLQFLPHLDEIVPPASAPAPVPVFYVQPLPSVSAPAPNPSWHVRPWFEVWGYTGAHMFVAGNRMAPNGFAYHPLFSADLDLNLGLLPRKKLYLYSLSNFWGQRATAGQTHGNWDFTKREFDLTVGVAWNYFDRFEFRTFGYALSNLNRGTSQVVPNGYKDGMGFENRYYLAGTDIYDVSRLGFLSVGWMPSKSLVGGDGSDFKPSFFARAYLTYDLPWLNAYTYFDGQVTGDSGHGPRLYFVDAGVALRPFPSVTGLEFRVGGTDTLDTEVSNNRGLGYFAFRLLF